MYSVQAAKFLIVSPQTSKFLTYNFYYFLRSGNFLGRPGCSLQTTTLIAFSKYPRSTNALKIESHESLTSPLKRVELLSHSGKVRSSNWWKENH